jgi:three-Cys-motif partner protein
MGGATYIDLFCGAGRSKIKQTGKLIDGSPVLAWKASVAQGAPFSEVYIADTDRERLDACAERLRRLGAPVHAIHTDAETAASHIVPTLNPYGLHFAFVDPYNLGALSLRLIEALAPLRRMDILVHLSAMDLFRNAEQNILEEQDQFDRFAPGWREHVRTEAPQPEFRRDLIDYWKRCVDARGISASARMRAIKNSVNREMYWLLLLSRHPLAEKFWNIVLKYQPNQTGSLFDD